MPRIEFDEVLPYSAQDLFDLVIDAARYPEIVSVIKSTSTERLSETMLGVDATIEIPVLRAPIHYKCTLEHSDNPLSIRAIATKSPFKSMEGGLVFTPLPDGQTSVHCELDFDPGYNPIMMIASRVMQTQIQTGRDFVQRFLAEKQILEPVATEQTPSTTPPKKPAP
jgi:coenzyme Q-binding protein COQ10